MNHWQKVKRELEQAGVAFSKETSDYSGDTVWVARFDGKVIVTNITLSGCLQLAEAALGGNVLECS